MSVRWVVGLTSLEHLLWVSHCSNSMPTAPLWNRYCNITISLFRWGSPSTDIRKYAWSKVPLGQKDRRSGQSVFRPSLLPTTLFRRSPLAQPFENADHCFSWLLWPKPSPFAFCVSFIHPPTFRLVGFRDWISVIFTHLNRFSALLCLQWIWQEATLPR